MKGDGDSEALIVLSDLEEGYGLGTLHLEGGVDLHVEAVAVTVEDVTRDGIVNTIIEAVNPTYQNRVDNFEGVPELLERDGFLWFITAEPYAS